MGIKSLSKFLRDVAPELFELVHISEYRYKKIAVDVSLYLHSYKVLYQEKWLGAFIKLISVLRENDVHPVFVYDTGSPPEKEAEKKERADDRDKLRERVARLEEAVERYRNSGEVDEFLLQFQEKRRLLTPSKSIINIGAIEIALDKMQKQIIHITAQDYKLTKELFGVLQIPYVQAPLEAETACADLCIRGKVDAVLTEDTDVLAYGARVFLSKFNTQNGTCYRICYDALLEKLKLTSDQFLDFCIMCGTDYNKNIFRIGPSKAYKLISQYGSIEGVKKSGVDVSILNHIRTRELFRGFKKCTDVVPYSGIPDFSELQLFFVKKNLHFDVNAIMKSFVGKIVFEEDNKQN